MPPESQLIEALRREVGRDAALAEPDELIVYECDGLPHHKHLPRAVVFPNSTEETSEVMGVLARHQVPFTPRGAGTGLSGGALALNRGVVIELARMREILNVDEQNRTATVQTGVVNLQVSRAVAHLGLHYVPDPSSQPTCTIGGNIAENAGGVHCLKYGTTTDHVLGMRVVLAGGEIVDLGGATSGAPGYDLLGVFIGSEGTFGVATEATLKLVPIPPAVRTVLAEFPEVNDASRAVSAIIAAGLIPAGLEMMDGEIIRAVESSVFAAGLSIDIGAALLIELDGLEAGMDEEVERVRSICLNYRARTCRLARDANERKKLWAARKGAFGAIGRIAPDSMIQDAVVPRSRLPEVMAEAYRISAKYQLRLANVFHAGDGNLHPLICFDSRSPDDVRRVKEAGRELMETCVRAGGSITGEHGVGLDKRDFLPLIFSENDMAAMLRVRAAFDPTGLCNPGKIIPVIRGCGEARVVAETRSAATVSADPSQSNAGKPDGGRSLPSPSLSDLDLADRERASPPSTAVRRDISSQKVHFDPDKAAKQLSAIVGEQYIRPALSNSLLITPANVGEVCEIMKLAFREGWAVLPAGAATWLEIGNPLARLNLVISTTRLNKILEHEPADLIARVQAGVTLTAFNRELAEGGQWLPLDPPDDGRATIGGVVATGLGGPQFQGYGAPRNFVIGMKVILADGSVVNAGGRVVKNVAGYDLCKLFTGSYGTLGLISELTFKLRPRPTRQTTVLAVGPKNILPKAAQAILNRRLFPVAVELISESLANHIEVEISRGSVLLLTRFAGTDKTVGYQVEQAVALLRKEAGITDIDTLPEDEELWRRLAAVPLKSRHELCWRATVKPTEVFRFVDMVEREYDGSSLTWQAGVADGRIRVIEGPREPRESLKMIQGLRSLAESQDGSLVLENAPNEIKNGIDSWGGLGSSGTLMKRVKEQLDPSGLFSPGRW